MDQLYDYTQLNFLVELLKVCRLEIRRVYDGWDRLYLIGKDRDEGLSHFLDEIRFDESTLSYVQELLSLADIVDRSITKYEDSKISTYSEQLINLSCGNELRDEIIRNLRHYPRASQEAFFYLQLKNFSDDVDEVYEEVIKFIGATEIFDRWKPKIDWKKLAYLIDDLVGVRDSLLFVKGALQSFSSPTHHSQPFDFKTAVEDRGVIDYYLLPDGKLGAKELEPIESEVKDENLKVKILIAYQSGILSGTFHSLPVEKQYDILALLFGKSKGNVKNALTAMYGNANSDNNPKNLPTVVDRANNLIAEKDLGIPFVIGRQDN